MAVPIWNVHLGKQPPQGSSGESAPGLSSQYQQYFNEELEYIKETMIVILAEEYRFIRGQYGDPEQAMAWMKNNVLKDIDQEAFKKWANEAARTEQLMASQGGLNPNPSSIGDVSTHTSDPQTGKRNSRGATRAEKRPDLSSDYHNRYFGFKEVGKLAKLCNHCYRSGKDCIPIVDGQGGCYNCPEKQCHYIYYKAAKGLEEERRKKLTEAERKQEDQYWKSMREMNTGGQHEAGADEMDTGVGFGTESWNDPAYSGEAESSGFAIDAWGNPIAADQLTYSDPSFQQTWQQSNQPADEWGEEPGSDFYHGEDVYNYDK
ncbi:hypothetical protein PG987_010676 [Apiospora arundinis]